MSVERILATRRTAVEVLRRHSIERVLRAAIRSANLAQEPGSSAPRMSEADWVDSCGLVRGVDPLLLDIVGVQQTRAAGWVWREVLVEVQDEDYEVRVERVPVALTLVQSAQQLGVVLSYHEARAMHAAAVQKVVDNQVRRAGAREAA